MDNIAFSLTRVSKTLSKKPVYRAVVQTNAVFGHEELAQRMAERTKQDDKYWKYILDVLSNEIETQLLAGMTPMPRRTGLSLHDKRQPWNRRVAGCSSTSSSTMVRFAAEKEMPTSVMRFPESAYLPA